MTKNAELGILAALLCFWRFYGMEGFGETGIGLLQGQAATIEHLQLKLIHFYQPMCYPKAHGFYLSCMSCFLSISFVILLPQPSFPPVLY